MSNHNDQPETLEKESAPKVEKVPENQEEGRFEKMSEGGEQNPENEKAEAVDFAADKSAVVEQSAEQSVEERIAELEAQLAEANNQYLRKAADFENFRKRMNREKQEAIEFANQSLLLDLIQIMDDFERALIAGEPFAKGEFSAFYEGISMIEKRLSTQLENKWGLKRFHSMGQAFDPNFHEAVQMQKSDEITEATVQEEYYKGYTLKERVVRSAKVKVLVPDAAQETGNKEGAAAE